jgi:chromosome segregation protein
MYLSRLQLHGFKSFASRTEIHFDPGVTAIVGPNGCGKSNVVDAVRWVIGEQRARILRSEKMENVIFNGTSKKRPLGMAEVLLTIENTRSVLPVEYAEVTIGRRLYRSGESEYLLNGVECRLKDITDLFMDTGMGAGAYSVIELHMVEELLSDNAQDRRRLFEEAAGITKYKLRRAQTLRKLDTTKTDLVRLRDIVDEIEKRVRSLRRQAKSASRYKEVQEKLRQLELALARLEYDRLDEIVGSVSGELQTLQDTLEGQTAQHAQLEADLEALRTDEITAEKELSRRQVVLTEHLDEVRTITSDIRLKSERIEGATRERARIVQEQADVKEQLQRLATSIEDNTAALQGAQETLESAADVVEDRTVDRDQALEALEEASERVSELRRVEDELSAKRADFVRTLDRNTSRLDVLAREQELTGTGLCRLAQESADWTPRIAAAEKSVTEFTERVLSGRAGIQEREQASAEAQRQLAEATDLLGRMESQREAAAAEAGVLGSLIESYDDLSDAVQYLAETSGTWTTSDFETVADILSCDDADRRAVEAALGDLAACIVVNSESEAHAALSNLRRDERGRATFLIAERLDAGLEGVASRIRDNGRDSLAHRVKVRDQRHRLLPFALLHDCRIAETLDEARALVAEAETNARVFTRDGEWVNRTGLLHGGASRNGSSSNGRLGRREQHAAALERVRHYDDELIICRQEVDVLKARLETLSVAELRTDLSEQESALSDARAQLGRLEAQKESLDRQHAELIARGESLAAEADDLREEIALVESSLESADSSLAEARTARESAEADLAAVEVEHRLAVARFNEANLVAVESRNRFENLQRDLERSRQLTNDLERKLKRHEELTGELVELIRTEEDASAALRKKLETIQLTSPELDQSVSAAKDRLMACKAAISDLEAILRDIRRSKEVQMREENTRAVRLAEARTRMDDLVEHIREDYGVSLLADDVEVPDGLEVDEARREVSSLREKVRSMGPVNELALEEYESEKERLDFLSGQLVDLEQAESTLLETIDEINTTASRRFNDTFQEIQSNFSGLFKELFGEEASAEVVLEDPSDPLESSIEIFAKPRGKRPSVLAQLSGGEKTLTAIALLFGIYLVKPSPFCILDEVDAPLDDSNILRFMHLLRRFEDTTQFILVTHNKRTMEAADRMYGITMEEQGVSKLVGVRFEDTLEEVPAVTA